MSDSNIMTNKSLQDTELWENRQLGAEEEYVSVANTEHQTQFRNIVESVSKQTQDEKLQLISIRLPQTLIKDLKRIGELEGLGYQTLTRTILKRFVEAENRKEHNAVIAENERLARKVEELQKAICDQERECS